MAHVKRENRVLTVHEDLVSDYLFDGYDQIDSEGNVIKKATGGREIPLPEHNKVIDELESAKQTIKDLREELKVMEEENIRLDKVLKGHNNNNRKQ